MSRYVSWWRNLNTSLCYSLSPGAGSGGLWKTWWLRCCLPGSWCRILLPGNHQSQSRGCKSSQTWLFTINLKAILWKITNIKITLWIYFCDNDSANINISCRVNMLIWCDFRTDSSASIMTTCLNRQNSPSQEAPHSFTWSPPEEPIKTAVSFTSKSRLQKRWTLSLRVRTHSGWKISEKPI